MWKQTRVTVGDETADQAMVDFDGNDPVVLEWPEFLLFNDEIKVGDTTYFAGFATACAGKFHIPLMREARRPRVEEQPPEPPAETPTRKGKKP
jgi:hypothetical protein